MRTVKSKYLALAAAAVLGLSACQDDFDAPGLQTPVASWTPNTTILELKTEYWDDATNYIDTVALTATGEHVIISGRVISSDASGNIYKSLVIQDETAALALSINANSLYNDYRIGQEVVIDVTDMYIGKYNGLQQLGFPEYYTAGQAWEATFMPLQFFKQHSQKNGLPEPAKIDTLKISYSEISSATPDVLRRYQSQLVRFNGAHFEGGGQLQFTDGSKVTSNRTLVLADGNSIIVRTSGYSNFWSDLLPEGDGDVVGILSYYGSSGWQLLLRSRRDLLNFGVETPEAGTLDNPYTVDELIGIESEGRTASGWVTGYIVGAVASGKTAVTSNADIEWTADVSMPNTLVIANTADVTDWNLCMVVELPQGTALRQYGNLLDNPGNYGKQIWLKGNFSKVLSTWGLTGNSGAASEFSIDGLEIPEKPGGGNENPGGGNDKPVTPPSGNTGTEDAPISVADALLFNNSGASAWVKGYIVGWVAGSSVDDARFGAPADRVGNILIAASADETDPAKCMVVELPSKSDIRKQLNLMDNPANLGKEVTVNASLRSYLGLHGLIQPKSFKL